MKRIIVTISIVITLAAHAAISWIIEQHTTYDLHYTQADQRNKSEDLQLLDNGIHSVETFFHSGYSRRFQVWIQPDRLSFDQAYSKNYHQPGFHSDCWLVATGDGYRISIIAPQTWDKQPCAGRYTDYSNRVKTQKLITHELIHVYHGQHNTDQELTGKNGTDWFIEGLAFYAAGQLGAEEITAVRQAFAQKKVPLKLDSISTYPDVNLRYSLWGSLVRYIDLRYGRQKLKSMLETDQKKKLLAMLGASEIQLLNSWQQSVKL